MPTITTYHCLCAQLLLATPYPLPTLPQRQPPGLDHARILPLGKLPVSTTQTDSGNAIVDIEAALESGSLSSPPQTSRNVPDQDSAVGGGAAGETARREEDGEILYSLLLNTTVDRKPVVVRRKDGFEKRWVRRCGRCRTGVGYGLEEKGNVVYLLEEGLLETKVLKEMAEREKGGALGGENRE